MDANCRTILPLVVSPEPRFKARAQALDARSAPPELRTPGVLGQPVDRRLKPIVLGVEAGPLRG